MADDARSSGASRRSSSAKPTKTNTPKAAEKFWKEPESLTEQHVVDYIERLNARRRGQQAADDTDHSTWESAPNSPCSASFGDNGMTATVNGYGLLMQFCNYLGVGSSGLLTADHGSVSEPYWVTHRAEQLHDMTRAPSLSHESYGLSLGGLKLKPGQIPKLSWRHWRWPSYKYGPEQFFDSSSSLTIDWMVQKNTLLQRCVLESSAKESSDTVIRFLKNLRIRELDHINSGYSSIFNKFAVSESGPGPGRYTWTWRVPCPSSEGNQKTDIAQSSDQGNSANIETAEPEENQSDGGLASESSSDDELSSQAESRRRQTRIVLGYFQDEGAQPPEISITEATEIREESPSKHHKEEVADEARNENRVVVVVASVFVNGVPKQFQTEQDWSLPHAWTEQNRKVPVEAQVAMNRLEVIVAYRMLLRPLADLDWQDLVIQVDDIDVDCFTEGASLNPTHLPSIDRISIPQSSNDMKDFETKPHVGQHEAQTLNSPSNEQAPAHIMDPSKAKHLLAIPSLGSSPYDHIEYVIWRNLEHILSVCSIPVGSKRNGGVQLVALTCGDMSMHRVCSSASFFALQFLVEISKRLTHLNDKSEPIRALQERIKKVCVGHIHWLMSADRSETGDFAANYWVTGKLYSNNGEYPSWQSREGIVDTPFQIIKAAEISGLYTQDETVQSLCKNFLGQIHGPWLEKLRKMDRRVKFAWPHAIEEGINTFRLDDHVWIWRALKVLHDLDLWGDWNHRSDKKKFSISDVQREILQRFTLKNDESGARMLAVTRSVREHRFLFHARDTALFYRLEFFLQNSSFRELWDSTIQAQAQHEDNQELVWDNAIRYALTIVMGTHGSQITSSRGASELIRGALDTLLQITSPNGFFPGQLGESAEGRPMPILFDEEEYRDFYFHAHFEICYVLLLNHDAISQLCIEKVAETNEDDTQQRLSPKELSRMGHNMEMQLSKISSDLANLTERVIIRQEQQPNSERHDRKTGVAMKKIFPFGSSIDSSQIVDIDEEWLFNYPTFLDGQLTPLPPLDQIHELIKKEKDKTTGDVVAQQMDLYRDGKKHFGFEHPPYWFVAIMDVPKQKHVGKMKNRQRNVGPQTFYMKRYAWKALKSHRKAESAKKRLIWWIAPDAETALLCYFTTPNDYQVAISVFFDRHSKRLTHFSDETSKVYNEWKTEVLFSFYVLRNKKDSLSQQSGYQGLSFQNYPAVQGSTLERCCMGFRFEGDIFDRYWTCHFVDSNRVEEDSQSSSTPSWVIHQSQRSRIIAALDNERDWRQRKVLELFFLRRMLDSTLEGTRNLVDELKTELTQGAELYAQSSSERYLATTHVHLQGLRSLLESIDKSLSSVLDVMKLWDARERDRAQQPRWTRNDERKYRESINNLRGSIERKVMDLKTLHADARSLKEEFISTLSTNVAKITENRSLSEEENLRLFTYVTVVFLPLGFAASIFSMSGIPDTPLLVDMIICAMISLILTVTMLLNAKRLAGIVRSTSRAIHKYSRKKKEKSHLAKHRMAKRRKTSKATHKHASNAIHDEKSWYISFWMAFVLMELPARRVFAASRVLVSLSHQAHNADTTTRHEDHPRDEEGNFEESKPPAKRVIDLATIVWMLVQVLGGLLFSPLFITSWIVQVIIYNAMDLLRLFYGSLPSMTSPHTKTVEEMDETGLDIWFRPGQWWRPIRHLRRRLQEKGQSQRGQVAPGNGDGQAKGRSNKGKEDVKGLKGRKDTGIVGASKD